MSELKTVETEADVSAFIATVENPTRRRDAHALVEIMRRVTGAVPKMWGPSIIGFGRYHYRYESGREGDMPRVGFSPRKASLVLYLAAHDAKIDTLRERLGKHRTSVACIYINKLSDVDAAVLEAMIARSWEAARERYGETE